MLETYKRYSVHETGMTKGEISARHFPLNLGATQACVSTGLRYMPTLSSSTISERNRSYPAVEVLVISVRIMRYASVYWMPDLSSLRASIENTHVHS